MSQAKELLEFSDFVVLAEQDSELANMWKSIIQSLKDLSDKVQKATHTLPNFPNKDYISNSRSVLLNLSFTLAQISELSKSISDDMENLSNKVSNI